MKKNYHSSKVIRDVLDEQLEKLLDISENKSLTVMEQIELSKAIKYMLRGMAEVD